VTERASARKPSDRKAPDAFRTIGELAESLGLPTHVLRFWESRFPQIRPVKGAGGRRYYRPADIALVNALRRLLHEDGLSIRAVQKMLRDQGVRQVAAMAAPQEIEAPTAEPAAPPPAPRAEAPVRIAASDGKVVALPRRRAAPPAIDAAQLCLPGFEPAKAAGPLPAALPVPPQAAAPAASLRPAPVPAAQDVGALYARLLALRDRMARAG
jgi:DNA-binding transcriptional MerR regulator